MCRATASPYAGAWFRRCRWHRFGLAVAAAVGLGCLLPRSGAAVIDWSTVDWVSGEKASSSYTVGPYQVTITASYVGGSSIDSSDGGLLYPRVQDWASLDDDALGIWMDCMGDNGTKNCVVIDIVFDQAVAGVYFTLADIDTGSQSYDWWSGRYSGWQDVVVVSALLGTEQQAVSGTPLGGNPSFGVDVNGNGYTTAGSGDLSLYGTRGNVSGSDSGGDILVYISDPVDSIQIIFAPGGTGFSDEDSLPYAGPDNPDGQRILLGNIYVPEPGAAALLLLAGAAALPRRRRRWWRAAG